MFDVKNASVPPMRLRRQKRTLITPTGEPMDRSAPVKRVEVFWQASVVDTTTNARVDGYPSLQGKEVMGTESSSNDTIAQSYYAACRFVDGQKPDIELLKQNVNSGIWAISSTVKGTQPL